MKDLAKLQKNFSAHLHKKSDRAILAELPYDSVEALARLNIYRNNVFGNFESVLTAIFPATIKILGEKKFSALLQKYCEEFPSKSGNLDDFGKDFSKLLRTAPLKELAELELLFHEAYFSPQPEEEFDLKNFKKLPAEKIGNLVFSLHPSCRFFESKNKIFSVWKNRKGKISPGKEFLLITSRSIFKLSAQEFLFLSLIKKGKSLYKTYQEICKTKKQTDIGKLLNRFIQDGIIVDYEGI